MLRGIRVVMSGILLLSASHAGYNIRTGEAVVIPAKRFVTFGAAGLMKERFVAGAQQHR